MTMINAILSITMCQALWLIILPTVIAVPIIIFNYEKIENFFRKLFSFILRITIPQIQWISPQAVLVRSLITIAIIFAISMTILFNNGGIKSCDKKEAKQMSFVEKISRKICNCP